MAEVELEIQRTVHAPVAEVFARLADIEGHNRWLPGRGSMLRTSRQTSPGPVGVGTTYEAVGERETLVRHDARLRAHGIYALGTPVLRIVARRERTATMEALVRSSEQVAS